MSQAVTFASNASQTDIARWNKPLTDSPDRIQESAGQFEAMLIGDMLRQVREAALSEQQDQASTTVLEMAEQRLAEVMAAQGGLGLASLVVKGLRHEPPAAT